MPAGNFCQPAVKYFYLPPGKLQNIEISTIAVKFPFFVKFLTIRWRGSFSCNFDKKMMKNTSKLQEITVKLTKLCNKSKERHGYVMNCGRHGVFLTHAPASAAPAQLENGIWTCELVNFGRNWTKNLHYLHFLTAAIPKIGKNAVIPVVECATALAEFDKHVEKRQVNKLREAPGAPAMTVKKYGSFKSD